MMQNTTPPGELVHYGVKGMHWGVRKAANTPNAGYSPYHRTQDKRAVGRGGVKKINRRMNKGETHQSARKSVIRNRAMKRLAVAGALYATPEILSFADKTKGSIAQRAQTKRGQAAVAATLGLPKKASNGPSFAKQSRNGAFKVTNV